MATHNPFAEYPDGKLYEALRIARVPDRLANAAEKEVRNMAGLNVFARIDALEKRLENEIRTLRWMMIVFFAFFGAVAAIGLFKG